MDVIIDQIFFNPDRVNPVTIQLTNTIPYIDCGTTNRTIWEGDSFSVKSNIDALMLCWGTNYP